MSYIGVPPFGQTVRTITELTASAGQTTFNVSGGYLPGYVDVFLNGVSLASGDFTSTNGSTVVLGAAASLNDEFKAIAYWPVSLTDTYRKSEADALLATKQAASPTLTTYASTGIGFRNRIINGDMRIDQRNAGASVTPASTAYGLDRWRLTVTQASKLSMQQNQGSVTPPAGYSNYLGVTSQSAYSVASTDYFTIMQRIEGYNISDLGWGAAGAVPITLSFWVRSSLTGTFGAALGNSDANRTYPFTYTINSANTWEQKSVTIAGDTSGTWLTNNGVGISLNFSLGAGSTYTGAAGNWQSANYWGGATGQTSVVGTNGATFYITGVQLEKGTAASPFEYRDYGRELIMCQRYFQKTQSLIAANYVAGGTTGFITWLFKVNMRAAPTVSYASGSTIAGTNNVSEDLVTAYRGGGDYVYINTGSTASAEL